jgi:DNA segregation ATPase FtsK/SpoIIIE, S-DNA-T family
MSVEHTTARLIARAIRQRLETRQVRFGLLARNLPPFDPQTLHDLFAADLVMPAPALRLALIGYTLTGSIDPNTVTTDVEQAVAWRNDPQVSSPLVVLLNPQHMAEKVHSLELLEPFEDNDLRRAIAREGQQSDSPQHQLIWRVLNSSELRRTLPLVAEQFASYYAAIEAGASLGDALPHLGLLRDPDVAQSAHERGALLKRLKLNHQLIQRLLVLDKKDYRALGRALGRNQTEHQQTFLAIQKYTQRPGFETLNQEIFTLAAVQALFRDKMPEPIDEITTDTPPSNESTSSPSPRRAVDDILFDLMLSHDEEQRDTLAGIAHEENEAYHEDPTTDQESGQSDTPPLTIFVGGQEATLPLFNDHPLETVMRQWVQNEVWGGIIDARQGIDPTLPIPRLFDSTTVLPKLYPFQPLQNGSAATDTQVSLFKLFSALDRVLKLPDQERLAPMLLTLRDQRSELTPYRIRFLYQPARATFDPQMFARIATYVETYEQLASRLQDLYRRQASEQYPDTIEQATAQFLALDSVIVARATDMNNRRGGEAALLTTLHPLHLWKWLELARRIQSNTTDFSPAEREFMQAKIAQLPTLLNTFLLHSAMFPPKLFAAPHHLEEPRLVLAGEIGNEATKATVGRRKPLARDRTGVGEIGNEVTKAMVGVPYYQPIAQHATSFVGLDKDRLEELLKDFLALYPPARIGLSLAVIDPPVLKPFLEACKKLADDQLLQGARLLIYHTDPQAQAYDPRALEDSEALNHFRNSSHWMINVDLEHTNYTEISATLAQNGPYHMIILCDPSEAVVQPIVRASQDDQPTPFSVPMHVAYDAIRDTVRRVPAPTGGIFDVYAGIRNVLSGELSRRTFGVGNRPAITDRALQELTLSTYWLVVLDRPSGTLELPAVGQKLAWQPVGNRALVVYTHDRTRWQEHLTDHLNQLAVRFDPALVNTYLREILTIFPNGLLETLAEPPATEAEAMHQALRQHSLQNLLGIVMTLYYYRQYHPATMLISIDNSELRTAFGWSVDTSVVNVAYLLAIWPESDQIHLDVIAVQTYDTTLGRLPALSESRSALRQLESFARKLEQLFKPGADTTLLDPMRRELLREYLSVAVFAPSTYELSEEQHAERIEVKSNWANVINNIFSAYSPLIRLRSVRIALQGSGQSYVQPFGTEPYTTEVVSLPSTILLLAPQSQSVISPTPLLSNDPSETTSPTDLSSVVDVAEQTKSTQQKLPEQPVSVLTSEILEQMPEIIEEGVSEQAQRLLQVLLDYGIAVASVDIEKTQIGPRVVRYWVKLQPPAGRLAEVQKYAVDLARELGSKSIPLIDNIPGERYIGIDLAREQPQFMPFAPALAQLPMQQPDNLLIAMGVNAAGQHIREDLVKMPHMLVAGTTGSGKTMFLTSLITSLALRHSPADLQLLLVDPKQTDFVIFDRLNHLRDDRVYYDPAEAIEALRIITGPELDQRTALLSQARCPNNLEYNRRNPTQRIPWLVIVVDEFADIMLTLPRNEREIFERQIGRLAAIGRAKGIHLVLATQRPTTDIITGTLKANFPARVSFRLPSLTDSRTILDRGGAEHLLGQGDMLVLINSEMQRLQGYYSPYDEIDRFLSSISH